MQGAWVLLAILMHIAPVGADRQQLRVIELLPATGSVTGAQIGVVNDAGAPGFAAFAAFSRPACPAMLGDNGFEVFAERFQRAALRAFEYCRVQIGQQVGFLGASDDKSAIVRALPDVVPALGG